MYEWNVLTKRDNLQAVSAVCSPAYTGSCGVSLFLGDWPGTKYPIGILQIAVWYGVAGLGTVHAPLIRSQYKGRFRRLCRSWSGLLLVVCLLAGSVGGYIVLGIFCTSIRKASELVQAAWKRGR
jgi:hypothetical protein